NFSRLERPVVTVHKISLKRMAKGKIVSYLRVSTDKQGRSGLGVEAQREAVTRHLNGGSWKLGRDVATRIRQACHKTGTNGINGDCKDNGNRGRRSSAAPSLSNLNGRTGALSRAGELPAPATSTSGQLPGGALSRYVIKRRASFNSLSRSFTWPWPRTAALCGVTLTA